jgi:hypothetical protein
MWDIVPIALHSRARRSPASRCIWRIAARSLFLFIGADPRTEWLRDCVRLDRHGFVITGPAAVAEVLNPGTLRLSCS